MKKLKLVAHENAEREIEDWQDAYYALEESIRNVANMLALGDLAASHADNGRAIFALLTAADMSKRMVDKYEELFEKAGAAAEKAKA